MWHILTRRDFHFWILDNYVIEGVKRLVVDVQIREVWRTLLVQVVRKSASPAVDLKAKCLIVIFLDKAPGTFFSYGTPANWQVQ